MDDSNNDAPPTAAPQPADDWMTATGVRVIAASADAVEVELTVARHHLQPYGVVHGGVHCGLIETVCSYGAALAAKARGHGGGVVGLENHTSFIRAVRLGAVLRCKATPITRGRTTQVWEASVRDDKDRIVATGRVRLLAVSLGDLG